MVVCSASEFSSSEDEYVPIASTSKGKKTSKAPPKKLQNDYKAGQVAQIIFQL